MDTITKGGKQYNLPAIEKDCWQRIIKGALQNRDVFQTPVVANANAWGINMRTVVLRNVWPDQKQLSFFTDTRSGKWAELRQQNNISWLFYDANIRTQIKAVGTATLHYNDELANKAWSGTNISNRKNYSTVLSPSAKTTQPASGLEQPGVTAEKSEAGRKNFGVVITHIKRMEWLWLGSDRHYRAAFVYGEDKNFIANWLVP